MGTTLKKTSHTARVFADIDISLDGFIAGENVSTSQPLGKSGECLVWYGDDINDDDVDLASKYDAIDALVLEECAAREGAVIMGRNTFDVSIEAWGDDPPIHKPCFVLTHRPAPTLFKGGEGGTTTFTFVTDLRDALRQALQAADGRDVGIMGGADTIRQYLSAGLLDELHLHLVPVLLGSGIRLFDGLDPDLFRFRSRRVQDGARATHLLYQITGKPD